jgi:hypothetical protein
MYKPSSATFTGLPIGRARCWELRSDLCRTEPARRHSVCRLAEDQLCNPRRGVSRLERARLALRFECFPHGHKCTDNRGSVCHPLQVEYQLLLMGLQELDESMCIRPELCRRAAQHGPTFADPGQVGQPRTHFAEERRRGFIKWLLSHARTGRKKT